MINKLPQINKDDIDFWAHETSSVQKIEQPEEPPSPPVYIEEISPSINYQNLPHSCALKELTAGDLSAMDGQAAKRVRRCVYKPQATLDLHGKTEKQAFDAVSNFIKTSYLQNRRCVLIITGKGLNKNDDDIFLSHGKLKERTPVWLNSEELRPLILGFINPTEQMGGSGALYIILKKRT